MAKLTAFVGIDPGASGALCLLIPSTKQVLFFETTAKPMDMVQWYKDIQAEFNLVVVMIENVHALFGSSAKSTFSFGRNVEKVNVIPLVTGCSVDLVNPKKWQKFIGIKTRSKTIKQDVAACCDRLYPLTNIRGPRGGLKDGKSDALMIAHYASQTFKI